MTQVTAIKNLKLYIQRFNGNQRKGIWVSNNGTIFIKIDEKNMDPDCKIKFQLYCNWWGWITPLEDEKNLSDPDQNKYKRYLG